MSLMYIRGVLLLAYINYTYELNLIFKHSISPCGVHISILTSTILAVLFVSPSKIALEKCYVY